jgi:hypothetical protein
MSANLHRGEHTVIMCAYSKGRVAQLVRAHGSHP